jgi:CBS-domain-containing membrane protein
MHHEVGADGLKTAYKIACQGMEGLLIRLLPAMASALTLGLIGLLGMWAGMPWLFPSLGPTIAIQTSAPDSTGARPYNVIAGHLVGLICGIVAVFVTGANQLPSVTASHELSLTHIGAAVLAVGLSMSIQTAFRAQHPPAEATTLLVGLGAIEPTLWSALTIAAGVGLVAFIGEVARKIASHAARR